MQINRSLIGAMAALTLGLLPMLDAAPAQAIGCLTGGAAGAVAGHMAGHHAVLGAIAGCAYGHHMHHKAEEERRNAANGNPH
jgi:sterol desaturase/sphingolipid hydroxylase (fatty acid hydroxylase superfamily)